MTRRRHRIMDARKFQRMLKEGRGQGSGDKYQPWRKISDFSSRGRRRRTACALTGFRIHHLFSDLEYFAFLHAWWDTHVLDIREHYPLLPIARTLEIAEGLGIRHPRDPESGFPLPQTLDFLLTTDEGLSAWSVMDDKDWTRSRTQRRHELAHVFCAERGIKLRLMLASELRTPFTANLSVIYDYRPARVAAGCPPEHEALRNYVIDVVDRHGEISALQLVQCAHVHLGVASSLSTPVIRRLLAERIIETDMHARNMLDDCVLSLAR